MPQNQKPPGASVELRSEMPGAGMSGPSLPQPLKGKKKLSPKMLGIIGGAVLIIIIIAFGVWAAVSSPGTQEVGEPADQGGIFGNLPGALDRAQRNTSGLSGNTCEHPNRRAIGVMLAGDPINRPMSGFSQADMVWELPVLVSNVTRLLAVYQCQEPTDIGSIRSARHDYLFLAEGVDAIVAHWGGSYHALNRIAAGEFQTINALTNPFNAYFRKDTLPAPYNGFSTYERLWNALVQLGYRQETEFEGYAFQDDGPADERPAGGTLSIGWPGQFRVSYEYDPETNRYVRYWAGVKQVDAADGQTVAPSSIVIMRATNEFTDGPGGYNDVGIEGEGPIEVYQDGKVITGTWRKDERYKNDPVHFLNEQGEDIRFVRGQLWVMTPSNDISVTWEPASAEPAGSAEQPAS